MLHRRALTASRLLEWYRTLLAADFDDMLDVAGLAASVALHAGLLEEARSFIALASDQPLARWLHAIERYASDDPRGAGTLLVVAADEDEELAEGVLGFVGALRDGADPPRVPADIAEDVAALMDAAAGSPGAVRCLGATLSLWDGEREA